ncbi:MAG: hypothetical protein ACUVQO_22915 [Leptodesmis sp.]
MKSKGHYWVSKKSSQRFKGYPAATVAFYGPDDRLATKVAVGIVDQDNEVQALERWFSQDESDIRRQNSVFREILRFIETQGAKSVVMTDGIFGCPHEEGIDYPEGESCPQCPFWGK